MTDIQWYPGHMTKARRQMEEDLKLVDMILELADARIPVSSRNPDIDRMTRGKPRVVIFGRADLADPVVTEAAVKAVSGEGVQALAMDARSRKDLAKLRKACETAGKEKRERDLRRGILADRPLRAMVAGIPNCGKSTLINTIAGGARTKTGNKPGVTKGRQFISASGFVLLDTPGILWPKFEDPEVGLRLAATGAVGTNAIDPREIALWLIGYLRASYPGALGGRYGIDEADPFLTGNEDVFRKIGEKRGYYKKGQEVDEDRTAAMLLDEFRSGKTGRISLERADV